MDMIWLEQNVVRQRRNVSEVHRRSQRYIPFSGRIDAPRRKENSRFRKLTRDHGGRNNNFDQANRIILVTWGQVCLTVHDTKLSSLSIYCLYMRSDLGLLLGN